MALFQNSQGFRKVVSSIFDVLHTPGTIVPHSGIYECRWCGDEIACNRGTPFPPQNHHQHTNWRLPIRWRLLVMTQQS